MGTIEIVFPSGGQPGILSKWRVRIDTMVSAGRVLFLYYNVTPGTEDAKGPEKKYRATRFGRVTKFLAKEGDIVQPGQVIMVLEGCRHPTVMKDLCAECGVDLRVERVDKDSESTKVSQASVPMVHSIPELKVCPELAEKIGKEDEQRLLKDRKLALLVDLDQTIVHTTNDNIPPNMKDVYHYQLYGTNSPWYHTRLRPNTRHFLSKMSQLYELHICTFGARNYAHTVAALLDKDGTLFSHRILSRDECFDPASKTANLKALFPCGDDLVCIIDDREDVWQGCGNLVQVKPYHFFRHTGDIHAPPGLEKNDVTCLPELQNTKELCTDEIPDEIDKNGIPELLCEDITNVDPQRGMPSVNEEIKIDELYKEIATANQAVASDNSEKEVTSAKQEITPDSSQDETTSVNQEIASDSPQHEIKSVNQEITTDSQQDETVSAIQDTTDNTVKEITSTNKEITTDDNLQKDIKCEDKESPCESAGDRANTKNVDTKNENEIQPDTSDKDNKDVIPEETPFSLENQTLSTTETDGPSIKSDKARLDESNVIDEDDDDYLLYLEDILKRIHAEFYANIEEETGRGSLRNIIPRVRARVLQGVHLTFSGLIPTHQKLHQSRAYKVARAFGAEVAQDLSDKTTHLVAIRPGTAKANAAKKNAKIKIVNPDWLWTSAERWEHVDERLFPLTAKARASRIPPPHCSSPERIEEEGVGDSFADSINPLMSFTQEEIENMAEEVEEDMADQELDIPPFDIEDTDITEESGRQIRERSSESGDSMNCENDADVPVRKKRKPCNESSEDENSSSEKEDYDVDDDDDDPVTRFRRGEDLPDDIDLGDNSQDSVDDLEVTDNEEEREWNLMGAALEREFLSE